jgi:hypothetical protein
MSLQARRSGENAALSGSSTWSEHKLRLARDLDAVDAAAATVRRTREVRKARLEQLSRRCEQNVSCVLGTLRENLAAFAHRAQHKSSAFDALVLRFLLRCVGEIEKAGVREERRAVADEVRDLERRRLLTSGGDWRSFLAHLAEDLVDTTGITVTNIDAVGCEDEFRRLSSWCETQARAIGSGGGRPMPQHATLRVVDIARIKLPPRVRTPSQRASTKEVLALGASVEPAVCLDRPALRAALHLVRRSALYAASGSTGAKGKGKGKPPADKSNAGVAAIAPMWQPLRHVAPARSATLRLLSPLVPLSAVPLSWIPGRAQPGMRGGKLLPHLYFCVEHQVLASAVASVGSAADADADNAVAAGVIDALCSVLGQTQSAVAPRGCPPRSVLRAPQPVFTVVGGTGEHRAAYRQPSANGVPKQDDVGAGMPNVLRATHAVAGVDDRRPDAHFAPATLHQLLATVHCVDLLEQMPAVAAAAGGGERDTREGAPSSPGDLHRLREHYWCGAAPPPASLPTLFVASSTARGDEPGESSSASSSSRRVQLFPLPDVAIRELVALYLLPGPWIGAAHARVAGAATARRPQPSAKSSTKLQAKGGQGAVGADEVVFPDAVRKMKCSVAALAGSARAAEIALACPVYIAPDTSEEERSASAHARGKHSPPSSPTATAARSYVLFTLSGAPDAPPASALSPPSAPRAVALCERRDCLNEVWGGRGGHGAARGAPDGLCELCQAMVRSGSSQPARSAASRVPRRGSSLEALIASTGSVMSTVERTAPASSAVPSLLRKSAERAVARVKERAAVEKRRKRRTEGAAPRTQRIADGVRLLGVDSFASPAAPLGLECTRWTPSGRAIFEAAPYRKASAAAAQALAALPDSVSELPPLWLHAEREMQWDWATLEQTRLALGSESSLLRQIETAEAGVTAQLRWLCDHGVYPAEELALIRREFRVIATDLSRRRAAAAAEAGGDPGTHASSRLRGGASQRAEGGGEALAGGSEKGDAELERKAAIRAELQFCKRKLSIIRACRDEHESAILAAEAELAEMQEQLKTARAHNDPHATSTGLHRNNPFSR